MSGIKDLYDKLSEKKFYTKSFEDFQAKYSTEEGKKSLYDKLSSVKYYTKSFDEFQAKYFGEQEAAPEKKPDGGEGPPDQDTPLSDGATSSAKDTLDGTSLEGFSGDDGNVVYESLQESEDYFMPESSIDKMEADKYKSSKKIKADVLDKYNMETAKSDIPDEVDTSDLDYKLSNLENYKYSLLRAQDRDGAIEFRESKKSEGAMSDKENLMFYAEAIYDKQEALIEKMKFHADVNDADALGKAKSEYDRLAETRKELFNKYPDVVSEFQRLRQQDIDLEVRARMNPGDFTTEQIGQSLVKGVAGILTLPRTVTANNEYGWTDAWGEWVDTWSGELNNGIFATPSYLNQPLYQKKKDSDEREFKGDLLLPKVTRTLSDMGVMLYGAKGLSMTGLGKTPSIMASSFVVSHDDYYKKFYEMTKDAEVSSELALKSATTSALLEAINPQKYLIGGPSFSKSLVTNAKNMIANGIPKKEVAKKAVEFTLKQIGQENIEELSQMASDKMYESMGERIAGVTPKGDTVGEVYETLAITTIVSGLTSIAGAKDTRSSLYQNSLYTIAQNPSMIPELREALEEKGVEPTEINKTISSIESMSKTIKSVPEGLDDGKKLEIAEKQEEIVELEEKKRNAPEVFKADLETEIEKKNAEISEIANTKTEEGPKEDVADGEAGSVESNGGTKPDTKEIGKEAVKKKSADQKKQDAIRGNNRLLDYVDDYNTKPSDDTFKTIQDMASEMGVELKNLPGGKIEAVGLKRQSTAGFEIEDGTPIKDRPSDTQRILGIIKEDSDLARVLGGLGVALSQNNTEKEIMAAVKDIEEGKHTERAEMLLNGIDQFVETGGAFQGKPITKEDIFREYESVDPRYDRKFRGEQLKSEGKKEHASSKRLRQDERFSELNKRLEEDSRYYEPQSNEDARKIAKEFVDSAVQEFGIEDGVEVAVDRVLADNKIDGSVRQFVLAEALSQSLKSNDVERQHVIYQKMQKRRMNVGREMQAGRFGEHEGNLAQDVKTNQFLKRERLLSKELEGEGKTASEVVEEIKKDVTVGKADIDKLKNSGVVRKGLSRIRKGKTAKKKIAKAINKLEQLKIKPDKGRLNDISTLLGETLYNGTISVIQKALNAGATVVDAINQGIDYIKSKSPGFKDEEKVKTFFNEQLKFLPESEIKKGLDELEVQINEILDSHWTERENIGKDLADHIVSKTGLSGNEARLIADEVKTELASMIKERQEKALTRLIGRSTIPSARKRKSMTEKIISQVNMGALDEAIYRDLMAQAFGFKPISPEIADKLSALNDERQKLLDDGNITLANDKLYEINKLLLEQKDVLSREYIHDLINDLLHTNALSGLMTQFNANFGLFASSMPEMITKFVSSPIAGTMALGKVFGRYGFGVGWRSAIKVLKDNRGEFDEVGTYIEGNAQGKVSPLDLYVTDGIIKYANQFKESSSLGEKAKNAGLFVGALLSQQYRMAFALKAADTLATHNFMEFNLFVDEYNNQLKKLGVGKFYNPLNRKLIKQAKQATEKALGIDKDNIQAVQEQVAKEVSEMKKADVPVPYNYVRQREKELINQKRDNEALESSIDTSKAWGLLGMPEGILGKAYHSVSKGMSYKDNPKDDKFIGAVNLAGKLLLRANFLFLRIMANTINVAINNTPLIGMLSALNGKYGVTFSHNKETGEYEKTNISNEKFARIMAQNAGFTLAMIGLLMHHFDFEEDEDGKTKIKLNPDRMVDITGGGTGNFGMDQAKGVEPYTIRFRKDDGTWTKGVPFKYSPHTLFALSMMGGLADEMKYSKNESTTYNVTKGTNSVFSAMNQMTFAGMLRSIESLLYASQGTKDVDGEIVEKGPVDVASEATKQFVLKPMKTLITPNFSRDMLNEYKAFSDTPVRHDDKSWGDFIMRGHPLLDGLVEGEKIDMFGYPIKHQSKLRFVGYIPSLVADDLHDAFLSHQEGKPEYDLLKQFPEAKISKAYKAPKTLKGERLTTQEREDLSLIVRKEYSDLIQKNIKSLRKSPSLESFEKQMQKLRSMAIKRGKAKYKKNP